MEMVIHLESKRLGEWIFTTSIEVYRHDDLTVLAGEVSHAPQASQEDHKHVLTLALRSS